MLKQDIEKGMDIMMYDELNPKKQKEYNRRIHKETFSCAVCKKDTSLDIKDSYLVNNNVWKQYGVERGVLCLNCLEKRMKRKLVKGDFADYDNRSNPYVLGLRMGLNLDSSKTIPIPDKNWINIGDNPEGAKKLNKYIETDGDGWRGKIVAFNKTHKEAIIIGDSRPGAMLLVKSESPGCYPTVVQTVKEIPNGWEKVE